MWEGRTACPRPLGETALTPRPANLSCQLFRQWEGEVVRLAAPHPRVGGSGVLLGTKHGEEWVMFLAEIRPAGTYHTLGLCWGQGGGMGMSPFCKAHVSC